MPLVIEGKECACFGDPTTHGSPLAPGPGALTVLYNGRPIWRTLIDTHVCPIVKGVVPDVGGVVMLGAFRTMIMGGLAARKMDMVVEIPGGPNMILPGAMGMGGQAGQVEGANIETTDSLTGDIGQALHKLVEMFESPAAPPPGDVCTDKVGDMDVTRDANGDVKVGKNITIKPDPNDPNYQDKVVNNLAQINETPSGHQLLSDLDNANHTTTIQQVKNPGDGNSEEGNGWRNADGSPGAGSNSNVYFNPDRTSTGDQPWQTRPPGIGLAHELTHASQDVSGTTPKGKSQNDARTNPDGSPVMENNYELETAGIPPKDTNPYNENKIRSEWNPPQPQRPYY